MTPVSGPPIPIQGFNGLFSRGQTDACPPDHLTDCVNCVFPGNGQVRTREGLDTLNFLPHNAISFFPYVIRTNVSQVSGFIYLTDTGNLFDTATGSLLFTFPMPVDDFTAINLFGRVYISPKRIGRATIGTGFVYFWDGTNFLPAGGHAPGAAPTLSQTAAGIVDVGNHKVFVCFQTVTGFVTPPGPGNVIASDGSHNIHISSIPIGPAGTVGRVLLITRANEEEAFFVPGGTIFDNTSTTFDYNDFDTSLVISADYLHDVLENIPACSALKFYRGRLVFIGRNFDPDTTMFSRIDDPETVDTVNGVITVPGDFYVSGTNGGLIIRDILYLLKPNGTYSTQDSGDEPANWAVTVVDTAVGAFESGTSNFASALSAQDTLDQAIVCNQRGVMLFNGTYASSDLTWKIEQLWLSIDPRLFYLIQIAHDVWQNRVYISVPLGGASACNTLLMMDYAEGGLDGNSVKWSVWTFNSNVTKIGMSLISPVYTAGIVYKFTMATGLPQIYTLNPAFHLDYNTTRIVCSIRTAPVVKSIGDLSVYTLLRLRVFGSGKIAFVLIGQDLTVIQTVPGFNLSAYTQGQDLDRLINFTREKMSIQVNTDVSTPSAWFQLQRIDVFGHRQWMMSPALLQSS